MPVIWDREAIRLMGGICLRVDDRAELLIDGRTPEKVNLVNDYYLLDAVKDADVIIFAGKISSPAATSCVVSGSLNVD